MNYQITYSRRAKKDYEQIKRSHLSTKAKEIIEKLKDKPYDPPIEELVGNLKGAYSKRLNIQHRIVYEVHEKEKTVRVLAMWTHYDKL